MTRGGRPEMALGDLGDISFTAIKKNGKVVGYRARGRWRQPSDGVILQKEKSGPSKTAAKAALKDYVKYLNEQAGGGSNLVTPDTKIPDLADLWLKECEADDGIDSDTVDRYREEIEPSVPRLRKDGTPDARFKPGTLRVKTAFANLSVKDLTAPRYDQHEKAILAAGFKQKARFHRVIVSGMMDLAIRHGAIKPGDHPVSGTKPIRRDRTNPVSLKQEQLEGLRAQLRTWLRGEAIPGTPAYTHGPARDPDIVRIGDVMLGSGARPSEALGFRKCDVHRPKRPGDPWVVDIFGTVKQGGKGVGAYRQAHTKTGDDGKRSAILPSFTVAVLIEMGAEEWDEDDESPVFPSRAGGWRSPANFRRTWRDARGETYAWVVPKTFRKTVATVITREYGIGQAGLQLGHRRGSKVTEEHYVERELLVPDSSAALERFAGEHPTVGKVRDDRDTDAVPDRAEAS
ncbi:hypothetical protein ACWIGW_07800 [Nocardia brasiliensis]